MANTKSNVTAGKPAVGGAVSVAPTGSTLPTDATTALTASSFSGAYKSLGYISEDGLKNEHSPETDNIKAWGGDVVLTVSEGTEDKFTFKLIEILNTDVLKFVFGDNNVSGSLATGITLNVNGAIPDAKAIVIDMVLRDGALKRIVIPYAQITEVDEIEYADDDAVGYDVTVMALPDASGNTHYEYIVRSSSGTSGTSGTST